MEQQARAELLASQEADSTTTRPQPRFTGVDAAADEDLEALRAYTPVDVLA
jgi:hypothetical protein